MPPKHDKKKDARKSGKRNKDPVNKSGGRDKQKCSKGKVQDKCNNLVQSDKATYDTICKEVLNYKLVAPAVVSERLKIHGSLAREALQELTQGLIKLASKHTAQAIYTKNIKDGDAATSGEDMC